MLRFFKESKKECNEENLLEKRSDRRKQAETDAKMFYPWQKYLAGQLEESPDKRTVWCVLDEKGCNGKSHFQRVIIDLNDEDVLIMTSDKYRNMTYLTSQKSEYKTLILNVAHQCKTVNLKALEERKDGVVTGTKYKAKNRRNDPPHRVLLSNTPVIGMASPTIDGRFSILILDRILQTKIHTKCSFFLKTCPVFQRKRNRQFKCFKKNLKNHKFSSTCPFKVSVACKNQISSVGECRQKTW